NVGGGSGKAASPYIDGDLLEDSPTVNRLKAEEAADKTVNFTTPEGKQIYGKHIGIVYLKPASPIKAIETAFYGTVIGEKVPRKIDFSIISSVTILSKDFKEMSIRLDMFPDISVDELLKINPTYTDLKEKYTRTITMRIPLWSEGKLPLALVGTDSDSNLQYNIIALFSEIPDGQKIEFLGFSSHWWAIRSVTNDLSYPHRKIYMK
ncbi:MAG: hypothetical protein ABL859_00265, partial [Methylotenera sp.]